MSKLRGSKLTATGSYSGGTLSGALGLFSPMTAALPFLSLVYIAVQWLSLLTPSKLAGRIFGSAFTCLSIAAKIMTCIPRTKVYMSSLVAE